MKKYSKKVKTKINFLIPYSLDILHLKVHSFL